MRIWVLASGCGGWIPSEEMGEVIGIFESEAETKAALEQVAPRRRFPDDLHILEREVGALSGDWDQRWYLP